MPALTHIVIVALLGITNALSHADDNAELRVLVDRYVTAVNTHDLELGRQIWVRTSATSFLHPPGQQRGLEEITKAFNIGAMSNFSKHALHLTDVSIHLRNGRAAWAEFDWDLAAVLAKTGSTIQASGRQTLGFRKQQNSWKLAQVDDSGPATWREQ